MGWVLEKDIVGYNVKKKIIIFQHVKRIFIF